MKWEKFRETGTGTTDTTMPTPPVSSEATTASKEIDPNSVLMVADFFKAIAPDSSVNDFTESDSFSILFQSNTKALSISRGRVSCSVIVTPSLSNFFNGLHGGAVASIAERVAMACVKTVVCEDKHLFLGELSTSYLSSAPISSELVVEASVVRTGRNLSVVNVEFKIKETMKVTYLSRATFYHSPISKL
ncbi:PREDICTED: acyl-coenzyme A thioesterase 13-like [Camelina sativa]|uniref:Acyl-coenzyme A thioesterase 13-like n=1 Tax=Camelina sativa TaxID=90675 RepID=A0ABM0Z9S4_CAMSA|nr:PREDICTED: acyl-coenzyme A thioesterase 13-like [Camelina sativa]